MRYCITMERTQRVAVWYDANDDEDAEWRGDQILADFQEHPQKFADGDEEFEYAICSEDGGDIVTWTR